MYNYLSLKIILFVYLFIHFILFFIVIINLFFLFFWNKLQFYIGGGKAAHNSYVSHGHFLGSILIVSLVQFDLSQIDRDCRIKTELRQASQSTRDSIILTLYWIKCEIISIYLEKKNLLSNKWFYSKFWSMCNRNKSNSTNNYVI